MQKAFEEETPSAFWSIKRMLVTVFFPNGNKAFVWNGRNSFLILFSVWDRGR